MVFWHTLHQFVSYFYSAGVHKAGMTVIFLTVFFQRGSVVENEWQRCVVEGEMLIMPHTELGLFFVSTREGM